MKTRAVTCGLVALFLINGCTALPAGGGKTGTATAPHSPVVEQGARTADIVIDRPFDPARDRVAQFAPDQQEIARRWLKLTGISNPPRADLMAAYLALDRLFQQPSPDARVSWLDRPSGHRGTISVSAGFRVNARHCLLLLGEYHTQDSRIVRPLPICRKASDNIWRAAGSS